MEGSSKSLIIRSPRMDGLKYIVVNMPGVFILVIPEALDLDKLKFTTTDLKPGDNQELQISPIELDRLVEIIEKAGGILEESTE